MDQTIHLDIKGMHCAACATRIEKAVSKIDGVTSIYVNLTTEKGQVTFNEHLTSIFDITHKISKIGFEAANTFDNNIQSSQAKQKEMNLLRWKFIISALLTIPLAWSMFIHFNWATYIYVPVLFIHPLFQLAITIPIQFIIGFDFYNRAWKAVKNGSATMDVLVVMSTSAAFFYSHYLTIISLQSFDSSKPIILYYETSAFIITFILLGKLLEAKSKLKTTEAIQKLHQLQTKTATLYQGGKELSSPIEFIAPGDVIILKPGEKVPIDGQVVEGHSTINESLLTGESIPVEKNIGSKAYAGTMNQHGVLQIQVTKRDSETVLSQIIRIVEEAQASKAPIQHIADRMTGVFVPIVILIALATFGAWYIFFLPGSFNEALEKAIAVLIIACPCALGLATPTSVMVGSGRAAQMGILFKEGKFIELLGRCKTIALDKTGTLTKGTPHITDIYMDHLDENEFLTIIGAVENNSEHPIAKAIVQKIKTKIFSFPEAHQIISMPGYGMKASVNGKRVVIANPTYFINSRYPLPLRAHQLITKLEEEGKTVIVVFVDVYFAGLIAVADELKASSIAAVQDLKEMGLDVVMLTGDNEKSGMAIARKTGIKDFRAKMTPQDKTEFLYELQQDRNGVIMVGDGINDAPALAVANVGVALGTGSDIAMESGDVTIIKGDLERLIDAILISKKTMTNIKQNLFWAFLYNIIMIPLAILGFLAPWLAGAAMALSSVSVVLNSLRLKRVHL